MDKKPANVLLLLSIISLVLVVLSLFIEIPLIITNSLFVIMLSIMTWVNYKNDKKIQMFTGILVLLIFIGLIILSNV